MSQRVSWVRRCVDPIGIDLGSRYIRMLQLARSAERFEVIACAERMLPMGLNSLSDRDVIVAGMVSEMLKEGDFVGSDIVCSLNWSDLWLRSLRIGMMAEDEIGDVIRDEVIGRLGIVSQEAHVQFMIAGDVREGTELLQEVLVFVAGKTAVENRINMFKGLGLYPVAMDIGPCAIFRPFERFLHRNSDANKVNVFVDLGYKSSRIVVSRGMDVILVKAIPIAGQQFDQLICDKLDLEVGQATEIRFRLHRQYIASMEGEEHKLDADEIVTENMKRAILDTLRPATEELAKEIVLCMRYCSSTFRGLKYDSITVVGGEAYSQDILRLLYDRVGVPFLVGRPLLNIPFEAKINGTSRRCGHPEWTTALGLAMKPVHELAGVSS